MKGKVKFYDRTKRFGFIAGEDGKEYFVHETGLAQGVRIRDDDPVVFEVEEGEKGPKATNVTRDEGQESNEEAEESLDEAA
jgi:cold shock protein